MPLLGAKSKHSVGLSDIPNLLHLHSQGPFLQLAFSVGCIREGGGGEGGEEGGEGGGKGKELTSSGP